MIGGFQKKLTAWVEAGLISPEQSEGIFAHEKARKSGRLSRDLTHLGVFAILLGFVSVVASNWQLIPPFSKLALHTALNLGVMIAIIRIDPLTHPYKRDFCVNALFALFLTFIALIAQIYQLHGELYRTLLFWLAICTPFVWHWGRTYVAIVPWLGAFLTTLFIMVIDVGAFKDAWLWITMVTAIYLPFALITAAQSKLVARAKPGFIVPFYNLGLFLPGLFASIATFTFNERDRLTGAHALMLALMATGLLLTAFLLRPRKDKPQSFLLWSYLMISGLLVFIPVVFVGIKSPALAAILFILYWLYMIWLGARISSRTLTDWGIRLVMLRLCILYLEVFGSMLTKGFGMIVSGVLLILLIKYSSQIVAFGRRLAMR